MLDLINHAFAGCGSRRHRTIGAGEGYAAFLIEHTTTMVKTMLHPWATCQPGVGVPCNDRGASRVVQPIGVCELERGGTNTRRCPSGSDPPSFPTPGIVANVSEARAV